MYQIKLIGFRESREIILGETRTTCFSNWVHFTEIPCRFYQVAVNHQTPSANAKTELLCETKFEKIPSSVSQTTRGKLTVYNLEFAFHTIPKSKPVDKLIFFTKATIF